MFRRKETPNLPALSVVDGGAPPEGAAGDILIATKEVADLTGKAHRNVMVDARKMLTELHGEGGVLSFQHTHRNEQNGQEYPCFLLPKRELMIIVTGYSVTMRAALVDRVEQLELERRHPNVVALPQR